MGVGSCVETRLPEKPLLKRVVAEAVGVKWKRQKRDITKMEKDTAAAKVEKIA